MAPELRSESLDLTAVKEEVPDANQRRYESSAGDVPGKQHA